MASTNRPYRRLPGTGYRRTVPGWAIVLLFFVIGIFALLFRGRRIQLWQGEEHLLLVKWDGYREYYKRFDYRDIQALVVRKTPDGTIVNTVLLVVFCLFAGLALAVSDVGGRITLLFLAGIFGMLALVNALYGPTCRCALRTAVQTEELPSLDRLRRAREVFNRLRPLIENAQGGRLSARGDSRSVAGMDCGQCRRRARRRLCGGRPECAAENCRTRNSGWLT